VLRNLGLLGIGLFLAGATVANAATISTSGLFTQDDDVQLFQYYVLADGDVTVRTTSYAVGGFQTVLSVFDSAHNFLFSDSGYGANRDATLTWSSITGQLYIVALTQYLNESPGPGYTLEDGFSQVGTGNYTAQPPFNNPTPGGSFLMPGGEQRTANWAVEFSAADSTGLRVVPEPSTFVLLAGGSAAFLFLRRRRIGA